MARITPCFGTRQSLYIASDSVETGAWVSCPDESSTEWAHGTQNVARSITHARQDGRTPLYRTLGRYHHTFDKAVGLTGAAALGLSCWRETQRRLVERSGASAKFSQGVLMTAVISSTFSCIRLVSARDSIFSRSRGSVFELRRLKRQRPKSALMPSVRSIDGAASAK